MNATNFLLGIAVGDALGVPYEFSSRQQMINNPATDMIGYRVHNQAPGTWSDDTSLTICLALNIIDGYSLEGTAKNFIRWKNEAFWSAKNLVFDIGITTANAINQLSYLIHQGKIDELAFLSSNENEMENGNGALMRILPLYFVIKNLPLKEQFKLVWENAALTHKHIRSAMACMIYLNFGKHLASSIPPKQAYAQTQDEIKQLWKQLNFSKSEQAHFNRVIQTDIANYPKSSIKSGGYVIESLEASFWCLLNTTNYVDAVLTAINFGHDTDTTAAITGGLAGIIYGKKGINPEWIKKLSRASEIEMIGELLNQKFNNT